MVINFNLKMNNIIILLLLSCKTPSDTTNIQVTLPPECIDNRTELLDLQWVPLHMYLMDATEEYDTLL